MKNAFTIIVTGFVISVILIGCASTEKRDPQVAHVDYEQLCTQCHTLDRVETAQKVKTKLEMRKTIKRMSGKPESGIDPMDIGDIIDQIY